MPRRVAAPPRMNHASDFASSQAVFQSRAKALASLLAAGEERTRWWQPDELAAIFRHQISAPLLADLTASTAPSAGSEQLLADAEGLPLNSFSDLLQHAAPPVKLLERVKDFAKANLDHPESGLPPDIASALYYASIAAALVRSNTRITKLLDAGLQRGFTWTREQIWLDAPTRELMTLALARLADGPKGAVA